MRILILIAVVFSWGLHTSLAQVNSDETRFAAVDAHVAEVTKEFIFHPQALAIKLIENQGNDYDKVRAFYVWIAKNIEYDFLAYIHDSNSSESVQEITRSGKALCNGFSLLFAYFCEQAGIEVEIIAGYAKGYGYKEGQKFGASNHAWNAVNIYGTWHLLDATWATGNPENLSKHQKKVDLDTYFLTNPEKFIKSHLPEDPSWQLLDQKVSLEEFESDQYENDQDWIYNTWSPDDYRDLDDYDRDLLYYKRAVEFSQRNRALSTSLAYAYLYKGISLTDDLWKMKYIDLRDSAERLSTHFYAYMDSTWQCARQQKYIYSATHQRIINHEIIYQSGVFNYEIAVELYSKANDQTNIPTPPDDLVVKHFNAAKKHFEDVSKTSIYFTDTNEYLALIKDFEERSSIKWSND